MSDRLKCPVCGIPTIEDASDVTEEDRLCNLHAEKGIMKAILTTFLGDCFVASDGDNAVTVPYDASLSTMDNHDAAAVALCHKLKWGGTLCRGGLRQDKQDIGNVYVWVNQVDVFDVSPDGKNFPADGGDTVKRRHRL